MLQPTHTHTLIPYTTLFRSAFKKVISRRNIRRRITIPLTLSNLKLLRRITRTENILHRNLRLLRVSGIVMRSEERFSRNAETDLVCRLLLEKKKEAYRPAACVLYTSA